MYANTAVTSTIMTEPRPAARRVDLLIDSMSPGCGTDDPRGGPEPNLWITGPDVDNSVRQRPPVGEGLVAGGRIFSAVRVSGLTSRARARSPGFRTTCRGESHGVRRSLKFSLQGPGTATGTRASGHPAASDKPSSA